MLLKTADITLGIIYCLFGSVIWTKRHLGLEKLLLNTELAGEQLSRVAFKVWSKDFYEMKMKLSNYRLQHAL